MDLSFGRGSMGSSSSRTKRMRTSFKHHQLRTMKSYFAINHNPDAKDLKQLSQKTGLPKRVLQVRIALERVNASMVTDSLPLISPSFRFGSKTPAPNGDE
jgi:Homeodomain